MSAKMGANLCVFSIPRNNHISVVDLCISSPFSNVTPLFFPYMLLIHYCHVTFFLVAKTIAMLFRFFIFRKVFRVQET